MRNTIITLAALAAFSAPAQAVVVLSETFDAENGGATELNFADFTNFTVEGNVDLIANGAFGIVCTGSCVDLDGSPGSGALISQTFGYSTGDIFSFTFSIGGNQRTTGGSDDVYLELYDAVTNTLIEGGSLVILDNAGFTTFNDTFETTGNGSFYFKLGTKSTDNQGPLLDSVLVEVTSSIPEPATWAMMIGGFGLVGASMRRRKVSVRFA